MNLGTVALIEDDEILSDLLTDDLVTAGFEVKQAYDGLAGLELIRQFKPQLILLDLILPKKSGFDVLREIKSTPQTADLPVVILSMLSDDDTVAKGLELGAEGYVVKSDHTSAEIVEKLKRFANSN
jgi:two-component system alkaline phosphatase synthesis response regulator PhoP